MHEHYTHRLVLDRCYVIAVSRDVVSICGPLAGVGGGESAQSPNSLRPLYILYNTPKAPDSFTIYLLLRWDLHKIRVYVKHNQYSSNRLLHVIANHNNKNPTTEKQPTNSQYYIRTFITILSSTIFSTLIQQTNSLFTLLLNL